MNPITELLDATLWIGGVPILWREIIGNVFGLFSAWAGMRRIVWAWPIGIIGNALLFTVFMGGLFHTPQNLDLYGQAGRQIMFIIVSGYGWYQWSAAKRRALTPENAVAVVPRWASTKERIGIVIAAVVGTLSFAWIFQALGSWGPWADAWIFVGSILATYGMARGWTEFWLIWIGGPMGQECCTCEGAASRAARAHSYARPVVLSGECFVDVVGEALAAF